MVFPKLSHGPVFELLEPRLLMSADCLSTNDLIINNGIESGQLYDSQIIDSKTPIGSKQAIPPSTTKIAPSLAMARDQSLQKMTNGDSWSEIASGLCSPFMQVDPNGRIQVDIQLFDTSNDVIEAIKAAGVSVESLATQIATVQGWVSIESLGAIEEISDVKQISLPKYTITDSGDVSTDGDGILLADKVRNAFGMTGSGIKIGIISDDIDNWYDSYSSGDLPDLTGKINLRYANTADEGTAILEIIHDLAPDAELYFSSGMTTTNLISSIEWMRQQEVDIIIDDISDYSQPMFEEGDVSAAIEAAVGEGITYVTSAGNAGRDAGYYGRSHYQGAFVNSGSGYHDFLPGSSIDITKNMVVDSHAKISVYLQWSDPFGNSQNDYDLYLYNSDLTSLLAYSENVQNGSGSDPYESLAWENTGQSATTVKIVITKFSGSVRELEMYTTGSGTGAVEYNTRGDSIAGHKTESSIVVAAVDAGDTGQDAVEDYSSRGPSTIYTDFGNQIKTTFNSLDVAGIDKIQTKTGQLGHYDNPFAGTSAAAPHVAGIAALLLQIDPTLTPAQVQDLITSTAVDIESAGYDQLSGYGRVNALDAAYKAYKPTAPDLTAGSDSGFRNDDNNTNDATPTVSGTVPKASFIRLYVDGQEKGTQQLGENETTFNIDVLNALADGQRNTTIKVSASNQTPAGNLSQSSNALSVTIDTAAPAAPSVSATSTGVSWTDPTSGEVIFYSEDTRPNLAISGVDHGYEIRRDGNLVLSYQQSVSPFEEANALSENTYSYSVRSYDLAGNYADRLFKFRVDLTAPTFYPSAGGQNLKIDTDNNGSYEQVLNGYNDPVNGIRVDKVKVTFSEPVLGFDVFDLGFYRYQAGSYTAPNDGQTSQWLGQALYNAGVTVTQDEDDPTVWYIDHLSNITDLFSNPWDYTLVCSSSWEMDIEDPLGHYTLTMTGAHWTQYDV
ncbi:MAG: S8 family serine peptidase [Phycisphaeraceae bacterium]|nr:S8 family serine peptidase [Phycisphaeraceae bacterium]